MKKLFHSTLPAVAIALASWLHPTFSFATVEVDGLFYDLDDAAKTAVVAPGADKSIEFVTIPENITYEGVTYTVTAIADTAFLDCHVLNSVEIKSNSLTYIGFSAFERCWNLAELVLAEGVVTLNSEAFKDCDQLTSVNLPSTLKHIGGRSFMGCDNLTRINIPANVTYLGNKWVSGTPLKLLIAERETPKKINAEVFTGLDKENCILSVPVGAKEAYQKAKVWKEFPNIQEGIVEVGQCGDEVFYTINVDMTMTISGTGDMYNYEFRPKDNVLTKQPIETLVVEDGVTSIGAFAFSGMETLASITLPNSVTTIGAFAFYDTKWYNDQPEGMVYAGKVAYALKGADTEDADIVLEDGTLGIAPSAFFACFIKSLTIPSSVVSIIPFFEYNDFDLFMFETSFRNIGSITVDPENPIYDSRDNCNAIIETATNKLIARSDASTIPDGVTEIGTFSLCYLWDVVIPASVTVVDNLAFVPDLSYWTDGKEDKLFSVNSPAESIVMEGSVPPAITLSEQIANAWYMKDYDITHFLGVNTQDCILYVPLGSMSDYMNADGWKDFLHIVEYDPNVGPTGIENVRESTAASCQIFDLQGRRLNNASSHSIIIENGKMRIQR